MSRSSSDDDNIADKVPSDFVLNQNGTPVADYGRVFSLSETEREKLKDRKAELGVFFPPKNPNSRAVTTHYNRCQKQLHKLYNMAWEGSASSGRLFQFQIMRYKIEMQNMSQSATQVSSPQRIPPKKKASKSSSKAKRSRHESDV